MWGLGRTAYSLFDYIDRNYPKAKLVGAYDVNKVIFKRFVAENPSEIASEKAFCFVTSSQASLFAECYFKKIGREENTYFLCKDKYLTGE